MRAEPVPDPLALGVVGARTLAELGGLLRMLRRRHARQRRDRELSYREIAARTGWSHTAIGEYFTGKTLPPIDRFDALVGLLGATPAEQGVLATVRDRVAERRRGNGGGAEGGAEVRRLPVDARFAERVGAGPPGTAVCGAPGFGATRCRLVLALTGELGPAALGEVRESTDWSA